MLSILEDHSKTINIRHLILIARDFNLTYEQLDCLCTLTELEVEALDILALEAKPITNCPAVALQLAALTTLHGLRAYNGRTPSDINRAYTYK